MSFDARPASRGEADRARMARRDEARTSQSAVARVVRAMAHRTRSARSEHPADAEPGRIDALEARVERLEVAFEDLQDAVYRQAVAHDKELEELRERTKPEQIARDLSEDARKRGL